MREILSTIGLLASVSLAHAGPKEDAYQVVTQWAKAITDADADAIVGLHAPEASMIGTFGKVVLTRPEQIRKYFDAVVNSDRPRTASLDSSEAVVVDDNTVVIAGLDTITGTKDGQQIILKGRVTFVVARRAAGWMIMHLHRSPMPAT